jgi:hypothetical protein
VPGSPAEPLPGSLPTPSRRLDLSLAQVVGGSLAAATAAAAGSRLGVIGTISGAAIISVVASVASAFYTTSLRHTGHHVSSVLRRGAGGTKTRVPSRRFTGRRPGARQRVVGAAVVFALAALVVTGVELVTGRSLDGSAGTTIARTVQGQSPPGSGTPVTGPSRHRGASSPTATAEPSDTPTPSASPSATASASAEASPSASPAPSASPSSDPTASTTPSASPDPSPSADPTDTPSSSASPSPSGDAADAAAGGPAANAGEAGLSR